MMLGFWIVFWGACLWVGLCLLAILTGVDKPYDPPEY